MITSITNWKELLDALDQQAPSTYLASTLVAEMRREAHRLDTAGQTDQQIQTALLTTYGPTIAAIATMRADEHAEARFNRLRQDAVLHACNNHKSGV